MGEILKPDFHFSRKLTHLSRSLTRSLSPDGLPSRQSEMFFRNLDNLLKQRTKWLKLQKKYHKQACKPLLSLHEMSYSSRSQSPIKAWLYYARFKRRHVHSVGDAPRLKVRGYNRFNLIKEIKKLTRLESKM